MDMQLKKMFYRILNETDALDVNNEKKILKKLNDKNLTVTNFSDYKLKTIKKKKGKDVIIVNDKFETIFVFNEKKEMEYNVKKLTTDIDWENITVTKLVLNSKNVILFSHNNEWYIYFDDTIEKMNEQHKIYKTKKVHKIIMSNININTLDSSHKYFLIVRSEILNDVCKNESCNDLVTLLFTYDENMKICEKKSIQNIYNEKQYYFSCYDELCMSLDTIDSYDMINKRISSGGYLIWILNKNTEYECISCTTKIYKNILNLIKNINNRYKYYIQLYQSDKLGEILPYIHKYPGDIIKRINTSLKILSKEILNIYHLTRKQQNCVLYENLTNVYKKIIFNLHKKYINKKQISESSNFVNFYEKKSISIDVVYDHIKHMDENELIQLFHDRKQIFLNLDMVKYNYENIFIVNDMNIITQYELIKNN
jgi:hypothetical protein